MFAGRAGTNWIVRRFGSRVAVSINRSYVPRMMSQNSFKLYDRHTTAFLFIGVLGLVISARLTLILRMARVGSPATASALCTPKLHRPSQPAKQESVWSEAACRGRTWLKKRSAFWSRWRPASTRYRCVRPL
jgi:hypothetical protein